MPPPASRSPCGTALPALRAARRQGASEQGAGEQAARLDCLLAVMAVLDDTCVLYRGGAEGLGLIRRGAAAVLAAGGAASPAGRRRLDRLDHDCRARQLSPGGAADVLATAMFLDQLERYGDTMQTLNLEYHATHSAAGRAHVGVVGSGDLEILFEPGPDQTASVRVRTTVDGFDVVWRRVLDAFFAHHPVAGRYELNDFGATPGIVSLRLEQVLQISRKPVSQERNGQ